MPQNITASQILKNFRKTPRTDLVIDRLQKVEDRKRLEEDSQSRAIQSIAGAVNIGADAENKYKIAKDFGEFEGNFLDFLSKPQLAQESYDFGLEKVQEDPSLLGNDNWIDKFGTGLRNLFGTGKEGL